MTHPWQYDETIQVGTDYRDSDEVEAYDQRMAKVRNFSLEIEQISHALAIAPESTVWEIGTGTAELALGIALRCKRIYAIDVSEPMLAYAHAKARRRNIANIEFHTGGFLTGFHPPQPVDAIFTQLALHHLPDFWKLVGLKRLYRTLVKGGTFVMSDIVYPSFVEDYDRYFDEFLDDIRARAGDKMAAETARHIQKEYSTLDWIMEGILRQAGFRVHRKQYHGILTMYVCKK